MGVQRPMLIAGSGIIRITASGLGLAKDVRFADIDGDGVSHTTRHNVTRRQTNCNPAR
jgi:methyl coenzyme M reductase subunit D